MNSLKKGNLNIGPLSVPNMVAVLGIVAVVLLVALRAGFRPLNLG